MTNKINTLYQLAAEVGIDNPVADTVVKRIGKVLFKSTKCGIVFDTIDDGISVCGYAEGADAECMPITLKYPFAGYEFWQAVNTADEQGCELWHEWNDEEIEK